MTIINMSSLDKIFLEGDYFHCCQDVSSSSLQTLQKCLVRIDEEGFFLHWKPDGREGQIIDCGHLREVRTGLLSKDSKMYLTLESSEHSGVENLNDRIVALCSGSDVVNVNAFNLLSKDSATAQSWIAGLTKLINEPRIRNMSISTAMRKQWKKVCLNVNREGKISVKSIIKPFLAGRNSKTILQLLVDLGLPGGKNDSINVGQLTFELYRSICDRLNEQQDVKSVFNSICDDAEKSGVSVDNLKNWLNEHQRDPQLNEILFPMFDGKAAQLIIDTYEPNKEMAKKGLMSLDGFSAYLSSENNSAVYMDHLNLEQDMNQPFSHYFINSSHNTYLSGKQFNGKSSVDMYRYTLLAGCRCVELDCWDGKGDNQGEPIITHGKAMCTDILFQDVIYAIRDTAFVTSQYPVVLSFENHCSKPLQLKMAKYCEEIFGDALLRKPLDEYPLNTNVPLPSPNKLKGKIIIKNKRLKPADEKAQLERFLQHQDEQHEESQEDQISSHSTESYTRLCFAEEAHPELNRLVQSGEGDSEVSQNNSIILSSQNHKNVAKTESNKSTGSVFSIDESVKKPTIKKTNKRAESSATDVEINDNDLLLNYQYTETSSTNIHPLLSSFINYCQSVKFQGFKYSEEQKIHCHMSSFSESSGISALKTSAIEFVNYNKRQFSRIYPKGKRMDSSNYLPQIFWNAGCQMVSLNFQTPDVSMQLNNGKFEYNGGCGYILKPEIMRRTDRVFDPFSESPMDGVIAAHCSIKVLSGQYVSDKQIGTYVEVDMYGLPTDTIRKEQRTKVVYNNGLDPFYNSEAFVFRKVIMPRLALVRFAVHDENGKLLLQRVIPLDSLQCGYRFISLKTPPGVPVFSASLFCQIVIKSYVPDGMSEFVDALADPKKYLAIEEVRAKQMLEMGVDEDDIIENGSNISRKSKSSKKSLELKHSLEGRLSNNDGSIKSDIAPNSIKTKSSRQYLPSSDHLQQQNPVKDLLNRTPITIKKLSSSPSFTKLVNQHETELIKIKKKSDKAYQKIEIKRDKKISKFISKLEKDNGTSILKFLTKDRSKHVYKVTDDIKSKLDCLNEKERVEAEEILELYAKHANDHSAEKETLVANIRCNHQAAQEALLVKLLELLNETEKTNVMEAQKREMQRLQEHQTKSSMESTRSINSDKSIRNRAEKDRRIREISSSNAKRFVEERKMMMQRHHREVDALEKEQQEEAGSLKTEITEFVQENLKKIQENVESKKAPVDGANSVN